MNLPSPSLLRAIRAATAAVLVVGLIGAFTVDDDSDNEDRVATSARATTTVAEDAPAIGADVIGDTTTTTTVATATTTRASSATTTRGSAPVPDPGPTKPPASGVYVYAFTNKSDPSANGDTETRFENLPSQGGAARRRETYKDAQGTTLAHDETWAGDSVRITQSKITAQQGTVDCTWQPPVLVLAMPLAIGKSWSSDSTCTTTTQGVQLTIRQKAEFKVTGKVLEKVGDVSAPVWVIESTGTSSVRTPFGMTDTTITLVRHFASDRGLVTYEKGNGHSAAGDYEYERRIKSLTAR